jgi:hypothetical protein
MEIVSSKHKDSADSIPLSDLAKGSDVSGLMTSGDFMEAFEKYYGDGVQPGKTMDDLSEGELDAVDAAVAVAADPENHHSGVLEEAEEALFEKKKRRKRSSSMESDRLRKQKQHSRKGSIDAIVYEEEVKSSGSKPDSGTSTPSRKSFKGLITKIKRVLSKDKKPEEVKVSVDKVSSPVPKRKWSKTVNLSAELPAVLARIRSSSKGSEAAPSSPDLPLTSLGKSDSAKSGSFLSTPPKDFSPPKDGLGPLRDVREEKSRSSKRGKHARSRSSDATIDSFRTRQKRKNEEESLEIWRRLFDKVDDVEFVVGLIGKVEPMKLTEYKEAVNRAHMIEDFLGDEMASKLEFISDWPYDKLKSLSDMFEVFDDLNIRESSVSDESFENFVWKLTRYRSCRSVLKSHFPNIDIELQEKTLFGELAPFAASLLDRKIDVLRGMKLDHDEKAMLMVTYGKMLSSIHECLVFYNCCQSLGILAPDLHYVKDFDALKAKCDVAKSKAS